MLNQLIIWLINSIYWYYLSMCWLILNQLYNRMEKRHLNIRLLNSKLEELYQSNQNNIFGIMLGILLCAEVENGARKKREAKLLSNKVVVNLPCITEHEMRNFF